jgi:hypothetical protein
MITKPFSQETKQSVIAARLDRKTYDVLRKQAEADRRSLASLIRIILEDHVWGKPT